MSIKTKTPRRIGIYSGTFDPVHAGHISFALQAMGEANLDALYFVPERRPRNKVGTEHFGHRVAMLRRAIRPHTHFGILELEDISFSVERTLPRLRKRFPHDQLIFLVGSDVATHMEQWPHAKQLYDQIELVVGVRAQDKLEDIKQSLTLQAHQPQATTLVQSYAPTVSSRTIREALRRRMYAPGLLRSVERYSDSNWLYVSLI